jgi:hypothetical protein
VNFNTLSGLLKSAAAKRQKNLKAGLLIKRDNTKIKQVLAEDYGGN